MPRKYVDNAYNRSVGRVGLPLGSAVISRSSGGSSYGAGSSSYGAGSSSYGAGSSSHGAGSTSSGYNASYWGLASQPSSESSTRTYVDNSFNRRAGRVGLPVGSAVISSSTSGFSGNSSTKTYVDNDFNRRAERVELPVSTAAISSGTSGTRRSSSYGSNSSTSSFQTLPAVAKKVYVDNAFNRRLGRVGKPLGTVVVSRTSPTIGVPGVNHQEIEEYFGCDSRKTQRHMRSDGSSNLFGDLYKHMLLTPEKDLDEKYSTVPEEQLNAGVDEVLNQFTRVMEIKKWKNESRLEKEPKTDKKLLENFTGNRIPFEDIDLRSAIGSGAFGDVHVAKYQGSIIAVKKLRVQRVSKKRLKNFNEELRILCDLRHSNVVKFIGACVVTPNLCICMEYMKVSLYDALHIQEQSFSETQKLKLVSDVCTGLEYLHSRGVTHCDIKSQNVLLDYEADSMDETLTAKLTDFGLSMMKNDAESMSSACELFSPRGTPRYCAPEVLRGEFLGVTSWKSADVYSLSLIVYEIVCHKEPFEGLSVMQLTKQVGSLGKTPPIDGTLHVDPDVKVLLAVCWSRDEKIRPTSLQMKNFFVGRQHLYQFV